ncbi:flagellar hook protein [Photobacterium kishitanii]|uniref:Flagellar hook protein n=1 Tax=Photobacterium kishitanii TaxID=318456 RepID=A0A2T3KN49_9GAMM|nr:flagellar hook protein [Photobacterium kishitanii]PSV01505.1 flagellar hook protein [Photobacterium kishitanii]
MNILLSGLIGYAIKEVVVPFITDSVDDKQQPQQVSDKEVEGALFESNDLIKMVSSLIDIVV